MNKLSAPFHETKVFKVMAPGTADVLVDEDGVEFTVELYAPQSSRMQAYDEAAAQRQLLKNARTNGAANTDLKALRKSGALRLAHAIKSWHPVSPTGARITEEDIPFNEQAIAEALVDKGISWWLTEQLVRFFDQNAFVMTKEEIAENPKSKSSKKTEADS